jgi:enoyl-[acyl-carrier protein] reductase III
VTTTPQWALILGASSGFGAAVARELARTGLNICGVHMDRRETLPLADQVQRDIRDAGREAVFFNGNAADEAKRREVLDSLAGKPVRVLFHSVAFGSLKPLTGPEAVNQRQLEMTIDVMGNSLVYWTRDLMERDLMPHGGRIYAMTSEGGTKAIPQYGPVSAAKAVLEAHIRQLAVELAPRGITANAILAGVTDTPALRKIPGNERIVEIARARNPHGRLTVPEDIARCVSVLMSENTYWMTGNTIRVDGGEGTTG